VSFLKQLEAREVFDSRGRPTVEVEAISSAGTHARAIVPAGASTGRHEALELRDTDSKRFGGRGVRKAVENVRAEIARAVVGMDLEDQSAIDEKLIALDGTPNKSRLGANALLGVSMAVAQVAAIARGEELYLYLNHLWQSRVKPGEPADLVLPMPMVNMISGGLHAGRNLDFQDFLMVPVGAASYDQALEMAINVHSCLYSVLKDYGEQAALLADEGGYGPQLRTNSLAIDRILESVLACHMELGKDVAIALDIAATHLYDATSGRYRLTSAGDDLLEAPGMVALFVHWVRQFPIVSVEDGLAEDDWDGWTLLTERLGGSVQLVGDDLFCTQGERLRKGIECKAANAILIKPNQVGTLTETLDTIQLARQHGYRTVISARSGETEDTFIADLAVATAAGQIKIGSVARSERLAKYNRLLRIQEQLGTGARFAGRGAIEVATS
jgi:enolase